MSQDFQLTIANWLATADDTTVLNLAVRFEVQPGIIERWSHGTARPHPRIQEQIVRYIRGEDVIARARTVELKR